MLKFCLPTGTTSLKRPVESLEHPILGLQVSQTMLTPVSGFLLSASVTIPRTTWVKFWLKTMCVPGTCMKNKSSNHPVPLNFLITGFAVFAGKQH